MPEIEILFKFKPMNTTEDLIRFIRMIRKNQIYYPTYKELNDPLESCGYIVEESGYAGKSICQSADMEDKFVKREKLKYRVLSLTEDCFSPCMWTHYTNEYKGVCIGYWRKNNNVFSNAKPLSYIQDSIVSVKANGYGIVNDEDLDEELRNSFFYKNMDWKYEKEWRIVSSQKGEFFQYKQNDVACIIFGNQLDDILIQIIKDELEKKYSNIHMYRVCIGYRSFGINILPLSYEIKYDGSDTPFIHSVDELIKDIEQ